MQTYDFETVQGCVLTTIGDRRLLIDTGAPFSVGKIDEIEIAGTTFPLSSRCFGITIEQAEKGLETEVDVIIGGDLLAAFPFAIDWPRRRLLIGTSRSISDRVVASVPIATFFGIPVVNLLFRGDVIRALWDTGAKISYVGRDILDGLESVDTETDFYPGHGIFESPCYKVEAAVEGQSVDIRCGVLPFSLLFFLRAFGHTTILGNAGFKEFVVGFDYARKKAILSRPNDQMAINTDCCRRPDVNGQYLN